MTLRSERVMRMPPMKMVDAEAHGEAILEYLCPEALKRPTRINIKSWVDLQLQELGIHVYPASAKELGDREGATDPSGKQGDEITILLDEDLWDDLDIGGRKAHRANTTVAHEVSHAFVHVPIVRRRISLPGLVLPRAKRENLEAYEDQEWQAFAIAGCTLAPRRTIKMLGSPPTPGLISEVYGMSEAMAEKHLKRLKLIPR